MVFEKDKKDKIARLIGRGEDYEADDVPEPDRPKPAYDEDSATTKKSIHVNSHKSIPLDAEVSSPESIPDFIKAIRAIPSYLVIEQKDGTFQVYKKGQELPVLTGDAKTCKMSSPLDENILNTYVNANKGKKIIVNGCKSIDVAKKLIDACNASKPPVPIEFPDGMLKELGFTDYDFAKHPIPVSVPAAPYVEVMTKNMTKNMRPGKI